MSTYCKLLRVDEICSTGIMHIWSSGGRSVENICKHFVTQIQIVFCFLQNGKVFMFTGMLEMIRDVHQLSIVLGHEMAHVLLAHSVSHCVCGFVSNCIAEHLVVTETGCKSLICQDNMWLSIHILSLSSHCTMTTGAQTKGRTNRQGVT